MRILWLTNTPSLFNNSKTNYNGGGWISSLERIISNEEDIELGIGFFHHESTFKIRQGNTTYYPIGLYNTKYKKLKHNIFYSQYDQVEVSYFLKIINDFKPDIIHIFGSEKSFGLISQKISIPVIIHIQGLLYPILNAYFPPGVNKFSLLKMQAFSIIKIINLLRGLSFFTTNAKRELLILKGAKYFMGRTEWDKNVISIFSPGSQYFHCGEVLREEFYTEDSWKLPKRNKLIITSTISKAFYKGFDTIVKTAKLLKEYAVLDFEWHVFGITEYREWEIALGVKCSDLNIHLKGSVDSKQLVENLLNSNLYVHPSYIDNSPNSICEAQMLGLPVIGTNVGGIPSLIENGSTGILVPPNDPFTLAATIFELKSNPERAEMLGKNARTEALIRHNKDNIKKALIDIYKKIYNAKTTGESI